MCGLFLFMKKLTHEVKKKFPYLWFSGRCNLIKTTHTVFCRSNVLKWQRTGFHSLSRPLVRVLWHQLELFVHSFPAAQFPRRPEQKTASGSGKLFFRRNLSANSNRDIIHFKRDQRVISLKYLIRLQLLLWAAWGVVIKTKGNKPCGLHRCGEGWRSAADVAANAARSCTVN